MQNGFDYKPGKVPRAVKKIQLFGTPPKKFQNPIGLEQEEVIFLPSQPTPIPVSEKPQSTLADLKGLDIFEIGEKYKNAMPELCDRLCAAIADPLENQREVRRIMGAVGIEAVTYHNAFKRALIANNAQLLAGLCDEIHLERLYIGWAAYSDLCTEAFMLINNALTENKPDLIAPITPSVVEDLFESARIKKCAETFGKNNPMFKKWYEEKLAQGKKNAQAHEEKPQEEPSFNAWQIEDRTPAAYNKQTQILPRIQKFIEQNKIACAAVGIALGGLLTIRSQPSLQYPASWPFAPTIQRWIQFARS